MVLGAGMKPMVKDPDGKVKPDLPKPTTKDDAALAGEAVAEWKLLKKQVAEVVKIQSSRLEQAMVTGRQWTVEEFELLLVRHPLMTNLVRLLVCGVYDGAGGLSATFRVTEDLTYADAADEEFTLEAGARVGFVHPLLLAEADRQAWGEILSDYEIVAPFPQLGRPLHFLEPAEENDTEIKRYPKVKIPPTALVGTLERLNWQRGIPEDGGVYFSHSKPFYGANVTAIVEYEDGVPAGYMEGWDDQEISRCYFVPGIWRPEMYYSHDRGKLLELATINRVVLSEVLADLALIASKGK
jgi:hypothetical protein